MSVLDLIDRAVDAWVQMRTNRAIAKLSKENPDFAKMDVINAHMDKTGWGVDVAVHSDLVILAENMAEMLTKNKAENYLQLVMFPRVSSHIRPVEITLRWYYGGLTPAEKNAKLTEQVADKQAALDRANEAAEAAEARAERYEDALQQIDNWAKAYPLDVFPEPDFKRVREVLEADGITLDSVSASNMRHVITGVARIVENALKGGEE